MMSDVKNKMTEICNQITDLKIEYEKLRGNYIEELQDKLRKVVGMSFKDGDDIYFRIIDIPLVRYDKACTSFNEYQLPALLYYNDPTIRADVGRLIIHDVFSTASHAEDPVECIRGEYTEIPAEEFDAALEKAFDQIRALGKRGDAE